jgi:hypothetical protein
MDELMSEEKDTRREEIKGVIWAIHKIFPTRFPLPLGQDLKSTTARESMISFWSSLLADLRPGQALQSAHVALRTAIHPPTPGELRKSALAGVLAAPTGADAWGRVQAAISRYGRNRGAEAKKQLADPTTIRAIKAMGGWVYLCNSENQVADRSQFVKHFDRKISEAAAMVTAGHVDSLAAALEGRQQLTAANMQLGGPVSVGKLLGRGKGES